MLALWFSTDFELPFPKIVNFMKVTQSAFVQHPCVIDQRRNAASCERAPRKSNEDNLITL
jgi:hypothetical protein